MKRRPATRWSLPSPYQAMWLFAMFDLPVLTKTQRRLATKFRKDLLREGFCRLQLSVYARYCTSEESSNAYCQRIAAFLPPEGEVRMLAITEKQFCKQKSFYGGRGTRPERPPEQLMLF
jgi:CRISPR-associated protein Cas2